jgi:hypothetical protein
MMTGSKLINLKSNAFMYSNNRQEEKLMGNAFLLQWPQIYEDPTP